jgi:hypothetical protein
MLIEEIWIASWSQPNFKSDEDARLQLVNNYVISSRISPALIYR